MPTPDATRCIEPASLEAYLHERLEPSEEGRVEEHLGSCPECRDALERAAGDQDLWQGLQEHLRHAPLADAIGGETDELAAQS